MIRLVKSPHKQGFALSPELREYELKFILQGKPAPYYEIYLEAEPESEMTVTELKLSPVK